MAKTSKKYFSNTIETLEELKREYHELAKKYHPDMPKGSEQAMKAINAEYDQLFEQVKNYHKTKDGKKYEKATDEVPNAFRDIINNLLKNAGLRVEVIGCFIWVSGDTKPCKELLKSMGFKWHAAKTCWYKSPDGYKGGARTKTTLDDVRAMYGVQFSATGKGEQETAKPAIAG